MLERIIEGLFDYAGTYPPASLALDDAVEETLGFADSLERPYLVGSDLVLETREVPRLLELGQRLESRSARFRLAALVQAPLQSHTDLVSELKRLTVLLDRNGDDDGPPIRLVSVELKTDRAIDDLLENEIERLPHLSAVLGDRSPLLFIECERLREVDPDLRHELYSQIHDINTMNANLRIGLKVRCAGPSPYSRADLATVLSETAAFVLPLKATAGLHHPLVERERYRNDVGFLNLVVARLLLAKYGSDRLAHGDLQACLATENPRDFDLSEQALAWREFAITADDLDGGNDHSLLRIGSCSIREPDDDLARLFGSPETRHNGNDRSGSRSTLSRS